MRWCLGVRSCPWLSLCGAAALEVSNELIAADLDDDVLEGAVGALKPEHVRYCTVHGAALHRTVPL